ncbi:MAG: carbohydrate binding family 9 domain-containing protein [Acidobacteriia bacterium]|nr:carbohydrate binding family 9 domain-containing protein [Terriglobia bacterium]
MRNRIGPARATHQAWRAMLAVLCLPPLTVAIHAQSAAKAAAAATAQIKDVRIPKIQARPLLEQFLNGNSRSDMKRIDDFRQRQPGDGVPVSRKTAAWIGYDEKTFYAVFVCESPPGQTRARLSKREDVFNDDVVGVLLDTYHDRQRGYEFFVNPLGVQADAVESEGQNDDFSFDTLWYSEGRLTPDGFVAMLAIPFKSLRFSANQMQTWGFGLFRYIPTNNESSFWPYVTQKVEGFNQQLGNMSGLETISPGRNLQLIPYGAFSQSHFLDNPDGGVPSFKSKTDLRVGLDAKAVIHDCLTLDIALNPDFSQVESDDPQVTVNQRFEVQFPEKRPFFLENNGYFTTPETLFFSRRIVDPEFGARLTGKLGRWNIGVLAIDDRAPGDTGDPADPNQGDHAMIGVVRLQREFAKQSNAGFLFTDREFAGSYNRVGAVDARFKLSANWALTGQAMASETRDLDGTTSGGDAFNVDLHRQSRDYGYDLQYIDRSEGFRTDLGFVPRVNIRQLNQYAQRRFHPKSKVLLSWGPNLFMMGDLDHRNVQQDWRVSPGINLEFARSTFIGAYRAETFERFDNINFRRHDAGIGAHSEYFKRATLDWSYSKGTRTNYDTPTGLAAFRGDGSEMQAQFTVRPVSRLKLDEIYFLTRLYTRPDSFPGVPFLADARPSAVFVNHLARSRLNYQFTRELSLRVILDYNGVLENPLLISLDRQKRITGDVLVTYLIHPGTALYVGYTDQLENLALFPGSPPSVGRIGFPSTTTGRQFFAKISYLFRF